MAKAEKDANGPKKRRQKSAHTTADVKEAVFAFYCVKQSYAACAKKFGMPISTVFSLVNGQAGGPEELERIRTAKRADLIERAYRAAGRLVPLINPRNCGTIATSKTADASRAFESLIRSSHLMTPETPEKDQPAPVINVYTGMRPPPELAETKQAENVGPNTTTTADPYVTKPGDQPR